eukprot:CAMPEP_0167789858 /NCGR_PEP_ID=MMETSP0111_2-20121227/10948_1 /TAXON_ID=91324 /ORGANISM="Lotharella globosa, Strain CCCM811" /LENGTH=1760 /DNA_ID=CAMNT_0007682131 /DNA_START=48 /DNA_END=5330 /DNA_ORIENTATION=+
MAARASPIGYKEIIKLPSMAISAGSISFKNVTVQSEKYVVVKEDDKKKIAIVTCGAQRVKRLNNTGNPPFDHAIMNPTAEVVALRNGDGEGGTVLNIFSLQIKTNIKSSKVNEPVVFWKWITEKSIAVVTPKRVYHWSLEGQAEPKVMFERSQEKPESHWSGPVQVINYHESKDKQWLILGGLAKGKAGGIVGVLQVHSVKMNASQPTMPSHAACFARLTLEGRTQPSNLICFTTNGPTLQILELDPPSKDQAFKRKVQLQFKQAGDFPVSIHCDDAMGTLFILTQKGLLIAVEITTAKVFFANQTSKMIGSCLNNTDGGIVTVDGTGRVGHFFVEKKNVVKFICDTLGDLSSGLKIATRYNLPGADGYIEKQFNVLMNSQRYQEAMRMTADSPQGVLRTVNTLMQFRSLPKINGQPALLFYFNLLLNTPGATLNAIESIELAKPILQSGKPAGIAHIRDWLSKNKLTCSEELGDALKSVDLKLALQVYSQAKVPEKVIACFLALSSKEMDDGKANKIYTEIIRYAKAQNYTPDYCTLVGQLHRVNPVRAKDFALVLIGQEEETGSPLVDVGKLADTFMVSSDVKATTNILLEYLRPRGDREEDAGLQTRVLQINLIHNPRVADAILDSSDYSFSHFDKLKIAMSCENVGLYDRALEFYSDMKDYKRVLGHAPNMKIEHLQNFFGQLSPDEAIECLTQLLKNGVRANLRIVVEIAKKWSEQFTPKALIEMFEAFSCYEGIYWYTVSFVSECKDKELVFKCIEAGVKCSASVPQAIKFVTQICRVHEHYDPKEVKDFLLDANLKKDPRPLIYVCDRFGYVDELTEYMWKNKLEQLIQAYVQRMNPKSTPMVVGTLLHLNAPEEFIKKLLEAMRPPTDDAKFVAKLVGECEKVNRLVILQPWLESQAKDESKDPEVYNGLAKIYVDTGTGKQAESFLLENDMYDPAVVGAFCESRDPMLAVVAYKKAMGACDDQLIEVTTKNGFFKDQAKYLVVREDMDLWAKVLKEENKHRRELIDQVVATALPTAESAQQVSITVKAFMNADLPNELIELLERLILHDTSSGREQFRNNRNLQNLLILTAIKADKARVMDYVNRLDNYDGPQIAKIASHPEHKLYDEAFFIYKKFEMGVEAIQVLLQCKEDIEKATDFAQNWDKPDVWVILGKSQLEAKMVKEAISSFLKAEDPQYFEDVIFAAKAGSLYEELIDFLLMARAKLKNPILDNELIYSYAQTEKYGELEDFLNTKNNAKYPDVGERLFNEKLYLPAKIIYKHIKDNSKLALCYVHLKEFKNAVEAANDAGKIPVWKEVCFACVDAEEFKLAQRCAMHIIVYTNHLMELCQHYEYHGYFDQLIEVLEAGIQLQRAHQGIYTQLGICYCKYKEEKLMQHIKDYWSRLNIPKLLHSCRENQKWLEVVHLYSYYSQHDNAVETLMDHSAVCWSHDLFKKTVHQVSNSEMFYKAIEFYLQEQPLLLNDLCMDLAGKLDHQRVTTMIKRRERVPLIKEYLLSVQNEDKPIINEAINDLFFEEEDHKALLRSVDTYKSFDQASLATRLKKHELLEFRRIAAHIYGEMGRHEESIDLSKKDAMWDDAMKTAESSKDKKLAEGLLYFFVEKKEYECFSACLYTCYELIRPDVVLELAWRNNLVDFVMPYMVQTFTDYSSKMSTLFNKVQKLEEKLDEGKQKEEDEENKDGQGVPLTAPLMITAGPGMMGGPMGPPPMGPPMGGPGMGGMGGPPMGMGGPPMGGPPMGGMPPQGGPSPFFGQ